MNPNNEVKEAIEATRHSRDNMARDLLYVQSAAKHGQAIARQLGLGFLFKR